MEKLEISKSGEMTITLNVGKQIVQISNGQYKVEGTSKKEFNTMFEAALYSVALDVFHKKTWLELKEA